ncbi:MAG: hypothetical protein OHK0048_08370 [Rhodoferax sp.]
MLLGLLGSALSGTLGLSVALALSAWLYSGSERSLGDALTLAQPLLGSALEAHDVRGSLRSGGRIGQLRWQSDGLSVEAADLRLTWDWTALLRGTLQLDTVAAAQLRIADARPPGAEPPAPLTLPRWPVAVQANLRIETLRYNGRQTVSVQNLNGRYRYDHRQHRIDALSLRWAQGDYRLNATALLDTAGTLHIGLRGQATVPLGPDDHAPRDDITAQATLSGALGDAQIPWTVQALLAPAAPGRGATRAELQATLQPFQRRPLRLLKAHWQALDPADWWPGAPHGRLEGQATVQPQGDHWQAHLALRNATPGPWDQGALPLSELELRLYQQSQGWRIEQAHWRAPGALIDAQGQWQPQAQGPATWILNAQVQALDPAQIDSRAPRLSLRGSARVQHRESALDFALDLASAAAPHAQLTAQGAWQPSSLILRTLRVQSTDAELSGQAQLSYPGGPVQAQLSLHAPGLEAQLDGHLGSQQGQGELNLRARSISEFKKWLQRFPGLPEKLLKQELNGQAQLRLDWRGGWALDARDLHTTLVLDLPRLETPQVQLRETTLRLEGVPTALTLGAQGTATTQGHTVHAQTQAQLALRPGPGSGWQADLRLHRLILRQPPWQLRLTAPLSLAMQTSATQHSLRADPTQLQLEHADGPTAAVLTVQDLQWRQQRGGDLDPDVTQTRWQARGDLAHWPLAWALAWVPQAGSGPLRASTLTLGGPWQMGEAPDTGPTLSLTLQRQGGDLTLAESDPSPTAALGPPQAESTAAPLTAGAQTLTIDLQRRGAELQTRLLWDSARAGHIDARIRTVFGAPAAPWHWPQDAPLQGQIALTLPPLGLGSAFLPPGWRVRGEVSSQVRIGGTRSAPDWQGELKARGLALRSQVEGLDLHNGTLDARFSGDTLVLDRLTLDGAQPDAGRISLSGQAHWRPDGPQLTVNADLAQLRVSAHPSRRLTLSGPVQARLDAQRLNVQGQLRIDQALITLPESSTPSLGDDVHVRRRDAPAPSAPALGQRQLSLALKLDLGPAFQVRGRGLESRLAGQLTLTATPSRVPQLQGRVHTVQGSYRAYGQRLTIERGLIHFDGAADNPTLDILALRPLPGASQRVGVQILGTVNAPVVRLWADPELTEAEKLGWLLLGRAPSAGAGESALLQQAALSALGGGALSGGLAAALGLDELSVVNAEGAAGATLTLGKRLSQDFYVTYESSAANGMGVLSVFYDLSRNLTLRARASVQSTLDLIWTQRFD